MAAMYQGPLQAFLREPFTFRTPLNVKRKSAVELLEESKPLYVKSGNVLDAKQELAKNAAASGGEESRPGQRRSNMSAAGSDQLQAKLRRLLNTDDSRESINHETGRTKSDGKASVSGSTILMAGSSKSLPDLTCQPVTNPLLVAASYSLHTASLSNAVGRSIDNEDMVISRSENSESETERSSEKSYGQPPSPVRSISSLGGSTSKAETRQRRKEWEGLRTMVRSKSDGGRLPSPKQEVQEPLPTDLDNFFQFLGLTSAEYIALTEVESRSSSPVFFSSASSVDSCRRQSGEGRQGSQPQPLPSIVESNARVIKWLCHCTRS